MIRSLRNWKSRNQHQGKAYTSYNKCFYFVIELFVSFSSCSSLKYMLQCKLTIFVAKRVNGYSSQFRKYERFLKQFWREWKFETALLLIFVNATECNNAKSRQFNNKQKSNLLSVTFPLLLPLHTD